MSHFAKIDLDTSFTRLARKGTLAADFGPIKYYTVKGNPFPFKLLKLWRPDNIAWAEVCGETPAGPHRDHGLTTALNCYVETGDMTTYFWEERENARRLTFPGAHTANIYLEEDLAPAGSFKANVGDAYLLDVSQIHSVDNLPTGYRSFVQLSWRTRKLTDVHNLILGSL